MDIKDYKFKVGDIVITTEGEVGKLARICDCEMCRQRGFLEPSWVAKGDLLDIRYITKYDAECGFPEYYRIGEYRFCEFDKDEVLRKIDVHKKEIAILKKQLKVIEEIEKEGEEEFWNEADFIQGQNNR